MRGIVQQAVVRASPRAKGAPQTITFPTVADQDADARSLALGATSSAGLPVGYYVLEGPAEIDGDTLRFTAIPPRAKFPLKVTVVAWQFGREGDAPVRTAESVERGFYLRRTR